VLAEYGLSATMPEGADGEALLTLMGRDKKAVGGLTFVLDGPDGVEVVAGVDPDDAAAPLTRMIYEATRVRRAVGP
jgi:5-deoxy-5-amino-3-dehydroquinate synthase